MITIIYSTHKDDQYNNKFKQHLLQSSGLKDIQILEYTNHNQYSLSELYNKLFNFEISNSHNAEVDILHTLKCFKKLIKIGII